MSTEQPNSKTFSQRLEEAWYQPEQSLWQWKPISALYGFIQRLDAAWKKKRAWKSPVPVIVVGNISAGGTGKTPVVIALVEALQAQGYSPAVISRGYKSKARKYPYSVTAQSSVEEAGDEPFLIAKRTGVPVYVGPKRKKSIIALLKEHKCDVIISDDGLQHYQLARDIEICMIDGQRGVGNAKLLPQGPLREPLSRLQSVDFIFMNEFYLNEQQKTLLDKYAITVLRMRLLAFRKLSTDEQMSAALKEVHAVAGIGNPQKFFTSLRRQNFDITEHPFPDHHAFSEDDFAMLKGKPIFMTEKDAVKCAHLNIDNAYYQPITVEIPENVLEKLVNRLKQLG